MTKEGFAEAVLPRCSEKTAFFLEISQNSQENTCARVSFLIKLQAWNTFFYRKPKAAASGFVLWISWIARSSQLQMFFRIGALKNFAIFIGKQLCWSLFLIKF